MLTNAQHSRNTRLKRPRHGAGAHPTASSIAVRAAEKPRLATARASSRLDRDPPRCCCRYAEVLTSEPDERLVRKLFNADCALLMSPLLKADPISASSFVNEEVDELSVVLVVELLLADELLVSSMLVSES